MATEDPPIPPGNYQLEIYLRGLADERPSLPLEYDLLEAKAKQALSPEAFDYAAGGARATAWTPTGPRSVTGSWCRGCSATSASAISPHRS